MKGAEPNIASSPSRVADLASGSVERARVPAPGSRPVTRIMIPLAIALAVMGLLVFSAWERIIPATPVRVVPVVVKSVQAESAGTVTVQAPGWVEPDPHPYYASALADGIVESILVLEGEMVKSGQVVAQMVDDDAQLAVAQAEASLEQRRADLHAAEASLRAAEQNLEHLIGPRQEVASTAARAAEIDAELARLEADLLASRALHAEIEDELARKRELIASRAVSEAEVRRLELRSEAQAAVVGATEARRSVLHAQRARVEADQAAAQQTLELLIDEHYALASAQASEQRAKAAVRLAEARRDEAALFLDRMQVRSPVDGVVMVRLASPGSKLVRGGSPESAQVLRIYDPARLQVRVDVPLADAANVGVGQAAEIIVEVLPDHIFTGAVTRVVHEADIAKNTVEVKVAIDSPIPQITPEMLARVRFLAKVEAESDGVLRQRVFAPAQAITGSGEGGSAVLVVGPSKGDRGIVELRSISPGRAVVDGWREVADGLLPGDLIIMNPPAALGAGDRVRVLGEASLPAHAGGM